MFHFEIKYISGQKAATHKVDNVIFDESREYIYSVCYGDTFESTIDSHHNVKS